MFYCSLPRTLREFNKLVPLSIHPRSQRLRKCSSTPGRQCSFRFFHFEKDFKFHYCCRLSPKTYQSQNSPYITHDQSIRWVARIKGMITDDTHPISPISDQNQISPCITYDKRVRGVVGIKITNSQDVIYIKSAPIVIVRARRPSVIRIKFLLVLPMISESEESWALRSRTAKT